MSLFVPNRITDYILRYAQKIDITNSVLFKALDIAQEIEESHQFFMSGRSSSGLAASAIYIAAILTDERITQRDLCGVICESGICRVQEAAITRQVRAITQEVDVVMYQLRLLEAER